MLPEGDPPRRRGGARDGDRDRKHRVRAQRRLVGSSVERDQEGVDLRLIERVSTDERGSDRLADMPHRAEDTLACEAIRVAIAELPGLVASCRGARRHTRTREAAVAQLEIDLDGRATARVEDLPCEDARDRRGHADMPAVRSSAASSESGGASRSREPAARAASRSSGDRYSAGDLPSTRATMRQPTCPST